MIGLFCVQIIFVFLGASNAIVNRILEDNRDDNTNSVRFSYLLEGAIYLGVMIIAIVISSLLIHTVYTERSSLWPKVKKEVTFVIG